MKMARKVKSGFNFSNRVFYSLISLVVLSIVAFGVYVYTAPTAKPIQLFLIIQRLNIS